MMKNLMPMGRWLATASVGAAVLVLLGACASKGASEPRQTVSCTAPTTARPAPSGPALVTQDYGTAISPIPLNAVLFTNEGLAKRTAVQGIYSSRTESGTVRVSVRFVSCADQPLMVRARTSFLTKSMAPAEAPTAWQNVALTPNATALYSEISVAQDEVGMFLIEVAPL